MSTIDNNTKGKKEARKIKWKCDTPTTVTWEVSGRIKHTWFCGFRKLQNAQHVPFKTNDRIRNEKCRDNDQTQTNPRPQQSDDHQRHKKTAIDRAYTKQTKEATHRQKRKTLTGGHFMPVRAFCRATTRLQHFGFYPAQTPGGHSYMPRYYTAPTQDQQKCICHLKGYNTGHPGPGKS